MIGWQELILILAILLLVFGPTELPKMARELGKAVHEFNKASSGVMETVSPAPMAKNEENRNKALLEIARKLNINIEGKSTEQLLKEIATQIDKRENPN